MLFESNQDIFNIINKINQRIILLRNNKLFDQDLKQYSESFYSKHIHKWLDNNWIIKIELLNQENEELIDTLLDFYNQLGEILKQNNIKENKLNELEVSLLNFRVEDAKPCTTEEFKRLINEIKEVLGERVLSIRHGTIYKDAISFIVEINDPTPEETKSITRIISKFCFVHKLNPKTSISYGKSINTYSKDIRIGIYWPKISSSGGVINEDDKEISKNLAKRKFFINQAIQNKIKNLPPGIPPPNDKQLVNNIEYYQQLLQQSRLSPKNREFVQGVINRIKQNRGLASPSQLSILQKFKNGGISEKLNELDINTKHLLPIKILSKIKDDPDNDSYLANIFELLFYIVIYPTEISIFFDKKPDNNIKNLIKKLNQIKIPFQPHTDLSYIVGYIDIKPEYIKIIDPKNLLKKNITELEAKISKSSDEVFDYIANLMLNSNHYLIRIAVNNYTLQIRQNDGKSKWFLKEYLDGLSPQKLNKIYYDLKKIEKEINSKLKINESRTSELKNKFVGKQIDENEFNQITSISVPKPIYTEWLINCYIKEFKSQDKSIDDFLKLEPSHLIEFFEKNKNLFDNKDITSYSINSLNQKIMNINTEVGPASALSTLDLDKLAKAGFKNLGEMDGYQIIKIPKGKNSPEAWQTYKNIICQGRTRVCTASNYTRFEYYTTNDNLFLIINPEDEKAPYHVAKFNGEIKDKDDQKITDPKILGIIDKLK